MLDIFVLTVTSTITKVLPPSQLSFNFWFDPLFFNFSLALLFVIIPAKLGMGNTYIFGMLFFVGALFGGILGLLANITPWYDPAFFAFIVVAFVLLRGIF